MSIMPRETASSNEIPDLIMGYVVAGRGQVLEQAGVCLAAGDPAVPLEPEADPEAAASSAEAAGLEIMAVSTLGVAVAGPPESYLELTGGEVRPLERLEQTSANQSRYVTHLDLVGTGQPTQLGLGKSGATAVDSVVLERPRQLQGMFPAPIPPIVVRDYLRVPDDVAGILGAAKRHRQGNTGAGVRVAMVDTGQAAHPFFTHHGYDVAPTVVAVPGVAAHVDPHGHGTGESANIFAVAPRCRVEPYRASNNGGALVGAVTGFVMAKLSQPDVLTNSWGGDLPFGGAPSAADIALAREILDAVNRGIVVVFAAGNGSFSLEAQLPGVLSAGGVYSTRALDLQASNYASGYLSPYFAGRVVPNVCGLVGLLPRAQYLMLPVPPGCTLDESQALPADGAPGDGTSPNDGWALFSGTSAAAPQLAGAAALLLEQDGALSPADVIQQLEAGAQDVRAGSCHPRFANSAGVGQDHATGFGLAQL